MLKTYKIIITGQVQGVGFRPHVYVLAKEYNLSGTVSNNEEGVIVFITGLEKSILQFYKKLIQFPPPVSRIKNSTIAQIVSKSFDEFKIIPSQKGGQLNLSLTPDFAICDDCQKDIINPENKRYNYPFTTCVNCGPRWAITETFPFERNHTSIDKFPMCDECVEEYTNPIDRRFHSQTNTCETCGIDLVLVNNLGEKIETSKSYLFKKVVANRKSKAEIILRPKKKNKKLKTVKTLSFVSRYDNTALNLTLILRGRAKVDKYCVYFKECYHQATKYKGRLDCSACELHEDLSEPDGED